MPDAGSQGVTLLAHITDTHVAPNGRRNAVLKDRSVEILDDLVDQVIERRADTVVFGGDNIDNGPDGYADLDAFLGAAERLDRWLCIVGNHEAKDVVPGTGRISKEAFATRVAGHGIGPRRYCFSQVVGNVRIIGIDTTLVGTPGGHVSDRMMQFLARELRLAEEDHVVVVGHHLLARTWAPFRLDVWDAEYLVNNRDAVISLLATCPRVRAYLCGHHHASRIDRIAGRGDSGGFYHVLTPSPAAFPHAARLIAFHEHTMVIESIRPRCIEVVDQGQRAVQGGRKARRFSTLGSARAFSSYVGGRPEDNDAILPYNPTLRPSQAPPPPAPIRPRAS